MMVAILIHALQTESDVHSKEQFRFIVSFQSTLSKRRATSKVESYTRKSKISIHAPQAESDSKCLCATYSDYNFNPRSPSGERPTVYALPPTTLAVISIHALQAESDRHFRKILQIATLFQSTLSKRRATQFR